MSALSMRMMGTDFNPNYMQFFVETIDCSQELISIFHNPHRKGRPTTPADKRLWHLFCEVCASWIMTVLCQPRMLCFYWQALTKGARTIREVSTGGNYGLEDTVPFYVVLCCVFPKSWQLFDSQLQAVLGLYRYKLRRTFSAKNSVPAKSGGSGVTCCFDKPWH